VAGRLKVASFTVRATERQSITWKRMAQGEGYAAVGSWIADSLDRYLDGLKRAGKPVPLGWRRSAVFAVRTPQGGELQVSGLASHPFAYYRGTDAGADRYSDFFTLVFVPAGRIIATLRSAAQCRTLAAELARLWIRWGGEAPTEDPAPLLQRFQREDV
jgi:hypothetical protein